MESARTKLEKFCLIADLHLKQNDPLGFPVDGSNSRLLKKLSLHQLAVDTAIANDCTHMVVLGDTFDKVNPSDQLRNLYATYIRRAIDAGLTYIRILGNHETTGALGSGTGLDVSTLSNGRYIVVDKPCIIGDTAYIPEVDEKEILSFLSKIREVMPRPLRIFGHFGVSGAKYANGMKAEEGIDPRSIAPFTTFLGHIHKRQIVHDFGPHVQYVGCLARDDFGDAKVPTGCCIIHPLEQYEYIDFKDIDLIEVNRRYNNTLSYELPDTVEEGSVIKVNINYEKHQDLSSISREVTGLKDSLLSSGKICKVVIKFILDAGEEKNNAQIDDIFDIRKVVEAKAKADGINPGLGLGILETAYATREK